MRNTEPEPVRTDPIRRCRIHLKHIGKLEELWNALGQVVLRHVYERFDARTEAVECDLRVGSSGRSPRTLSRMA